MDVDNIIVGGKDREKKETNLNKVCLSLVDRNIQISIVERKSGREGKSFIDVVSQPEDLLQLLSENKPSGEKIDGKSPEECANQLSKATDTQKAKEEEPLLQMTSTDLCVESEKNKEEKMKVFELMQKITTDMKEEQTAEQKLELLTQQIKQRCTEVGTAALKKRKAYYDAIAQTNIMPPILDSLIPLSGMFIDPNKPKKFEKTVSIQIELIKECMALDMYAEKYEREDPHPPKGVFKARKARQELENKERSQTGVCRYIQFLLLACKQKVNSAVLSTMALQVKLGECHPALENFCLQAMDEFEKLLPGLFTSVPDSVFYNQPAEERYSEAVSAFRTVESLVPVKSNVKEVTQVALNLNYPQKLDRVCSGSLAPIPIFVDVFVQTVALFVLLLKIQDTFSRIFEARKATITDPKHALFTKSLGEMYQQMLVTFDPFLSKEGLVKFAGPARRQHLFITEVIDVYYGIWKSRLWGKDYEVYLAKPDISVFDSKQSTEFVRVLVKTQLLRVHAGECIAEMFSHDYPLVNIMASLRNSRKNKNNNNNK